MEQGKPAGHNCRTHGPQLLKPTGPTPRSPQEEGVTGGTARGMQTEARGCKRQALFLSLSSDRRRQMSDTFSLL